MLIILAWRPNSVSTSTSRRYKHTVIAAKQIVAVAHQSVSFFATLLYIALERRECQYTYGACPETRTYLNTVDRFATPPNWIRSASRYTPHTPLKDTLLKATRSAAYTRTPSETIQLYQQNKTTPKHQRRPNHLTLHHSPRTTSPRLTFLPYSIVLHRTRF